MVDEMLVAEKSGCHSKGKAVPAAKKRLSKGNLIPTKEGYLGAARLENTVK